MATTAKKRFRKHRIIGPGPTVDRPGQRRAFNFNTRRFGFGHSASAQLAALRSAVLKVGLALIGGDFSGTGRGSYALDLQGERTDPNQVAGGDKSVSLGNECTSSATGAVAIGLGPAASGVNALALGAAAAAGGNDSLALGSLSFAQSSQANAIGYSAAARIAKTTNISGPIIGQLNSFQANADWFQQLAGADIILRTAWLDAKTVADYVMTLPAGLRFWVDEVGVYVPSFTGVTAQPFVRFGINGTPQKDLANVQTLNLTGLGKRQMYVPLVPGDGETSLLFGIATAATGAGFYVAAYWRGILLEN